MLHATIGSKLCVCVIDFVLCISSSKLLQIVLLLQHHIKLTIAAHMWYESKIWNANTNEDLYNPEKTRRVSAWMIQHDLIIILLLFLHEGVGKIC